jgi:hypothetical protein
MKQQHEYPVPEQKQRGQSLVEVALFLPILIIIIAGVVEVSQLLITQNRVNTASRAAARFGANGGENEGIRRVIMNNVTQTLDLNEALWDIWVLRGQINDDGNNIEDWEFEHVYGISNTVRFDAVDENTLRQRVIDELGVDGRSTANLRFVGTYVQHDVDTILGLNALPGLDSYNSVSSLNVMRIVGEALEATRGCDAFPIGVHYLVRSATPPGSGGGSAYPEGNFDSHSPSPAYASFTRHVPDVPLADAQPGYIYAVRETQAAGGFGWLRWNTGATGSANVLARSLAWPGDSQDYTDRGNDPNYSTVAGSPFDHSVRGFIEPGDPTDTSMNIGDWVAGNTGNVNSSAVRDELLDHISRQREIRIIVWDETEGTGNNKNYQIHGFAVFKIHGFAITGNPKFIVAEFVRWDNSCGQQ